MKLKRARSCRSIQGLPVERLGQLADSSLCHWVALPGPPLAMHAVFLPAVGRL
jgi:hypothetical protein